MGRFLFTLWPFPGHLHPSIAIAHALRTRGHDVSFYTGTKESGTIKGEGFGFFPFEAVDELYIERLVFSQHHIPSLVKKPFRMISLYRTWLLDTVPDQVRDLEHICKKWHPTVIACDPTFWGPVLVVHESWSIPVAISSFLPGCMIPGPDAPPWGFGLPSPRNPRTKLLARTVEVASNCILTSFRRSVNQMRHRYDLQPIPSSVNAFTGHMPLYLIPSVPELDYQRKDLPACVHYVGPCVWNKPRDEEPPAWMDTVRSDQPLIHVTEGTMHSQDPFVLRAAAKGLANLGMEVIMTTGRDRDPSRLDLGPIAPNIRVERWVPHSVLLPRTDVMVTTGGAGTVLAGLNAGVPMVIIPTQWDKPDNAQRVIETGAGLRLSPRKCTPKRLRSTVERILDEPCFRQNAKRMATIFARCRGASRAAELLERLCA